VRGKNFEVNEEIKIPGMYRVKLPTYPNIKKGNKKR